jgi:hypothetical protein
MKTQDVSKKGLKYGDEDEDAAERKELNAQNIAFGPLLNWLKRELKSQVSDGTSLLFHVPYILLSRSFRYSLALIPAPGSRKLTTSRPHQQTGHLTMYHNSRLYGLVSKYAAYNGCTG